MGKEKFSMISQRQDSPLVAVMAQLCFLSRCFLVSSSQPLHVKTTAKVLADLPNSTGLPNDTIILSVWQNILITQMLSCSHYEGAWCHAQCQEKDKAVKFPTNSQMFYSLVKETSTTASFAGLCRFYFGCLFSLLQHYGLQYLFCFFLLHVILFLCSLPGCSPFLI